MKLKHSYMAGDSKIEIFTAVIDEEVVQKHLEEVSKETKLSRKSHRSLGHANRSGELEWIPSGTIMLHKDRRFKRSHVRLYKNKNSYYVMPYGSKPKYLTECEINYYDGVTIIFQFKFDW